MAKKKITRSEALLEMIGENVDEKQNVHIISRKGHWAVKVSDSNQIYKVTNSRNQAVRYAKYLTANSRIENIILHKKDGSIDRINPKATKV